MNREIKYRVWDKVKRKFLVPDEDDYRTNMAISFHGNLLLKTDNGACGDPECCGDYEEYFTTVDEYRYFINESTGIKDKNGKNIFVGDIVKHIEYQSDDNITVIESLQDFFEDRGYMTEEMCQDWKSNNFEVIGNIFENPELINNK